MTEDYLKWPECVAEGCKERTSIFWCAKCGKEIFLDDSQGGLWTGWTCDMDCHYNTTTIGACRTHGLTMSPKSKKPPAVK